MKGKDVIRHILRAEIPDVEQAKTRILQQATSQNKCQKRTAFRPVVAAITTAAAIICILLVNLVITAPQDGNVFTLRIYAMERQADGTLEFREIDIVNQSETWGGYFDGANLFINIALSFVGENVRSVEFITDVGFFAKQYLQLENGKIVMDGRPIVITGENNIALYGIDFEMVGNRFIFTASEMTDGLLLFLGQEFTEQGDIDIQQMIIRTNVVFDDNTTQEDAITINLTDRTGLIIVDDFIKADETRHDWFDGLPFEQLELIPESVKLITNACENGIVYQFLVSGALSSFLILEDELEFDERGIFQSGMMNVGGIVGGEVYVAVVRRDAYGILIGSVYRIPHEIVMILRD